MKVNIIILCNFWLFFLSCKEKQDIIDNSFSKKFNVDKTNLVINSNNEENQTFITGEFKYFSNIILLKIQFTLRIVFIIMIKIKSYLILVLKKNQVSLL